MGKGPLGVSHPHPRGDGIMARFGPSWVSKKVTVAAIPHPIVTHLSQILSGSMASVKDPGTPASSLVRDGLSKVDTLCPPA